MVDLTPEELNLAEKLEFDPDVLVVVKETTGGELSLHDNYFGYPNPKNEYEGLMLIGLEATIPAISWEDNTDPNFYLEDAADPYVEPLQEALEARGYYPFTLMRWHAFVEKKAISIVTTKAVDRDDLIMRTCAPTGCNYDMTAEIVAKTLRDWDDRFGIHILGLGGDRMRLKFDRLPPAFEAFASKPNEDWEDEGLQIFYELQKFCPDYANGPDPVAFIRSFARTRKTDFWWD